MATGCKLQARVACVCWTSMTRKGQEHIGIAQVLKGDTTSFITAFVGTKHDLDSVPHRLDRFQGAPQKPGPVMSRDDD